MPINSFKSPLSLIVKPSPLKWLIILIPHLVIFLLIIMVDVFPLWSKIILAIFVAFSFAYYYQYHLSLKLKKSIILIEQDSVENWLIKLSNIESNTEPKNAKLLPSSYISKLFIILNFEDIKGSHYSVLITPDSISRINYKHLYIRLKSTYIK
jgi:hypothetical protein